MTFYELFEQAPFDPALPFAWAQAPSKIRAHVQRMGAINPKDRPSALELIDDFQNTGLAKQPGVMFYNSSCCSVS